MEYYAKDDVERANRRHIVNRLKNARRHRSLEDPDTISRTIRNMRYNHYDVSNIAK